MVVKSKYVSRKHASVVKQYRLCFQTSTTFKPQKYFQLLFLKSKNLQAIYHKREYYFRVFINYLSILYKHLNKNIVAYISLYKLFK